MKTKTLAVFTALLAAPAWAQEPMSRAETFEYVSKALADIRQTMPPMQTSQSEESPAVMMYAVNAAIEKVTALRDALSGNAYVRVSGFTLGLPYGISVDFTFPEPDKVKRSVGTSNPEAGPDFRQ